ncbi:fasciclin domain-containing protein [Mucilaginibacter pocheonensis]|uniref:Surface protein with fasciclin (FAS1) repeats n=1 Tax=Mucilaginibacter pocheonensis TaxID=398050 RepID=A0ABU1T771_9SPHI|nr:fasciclin domain-containing protein [Mucilaginibacter pocheonensis]MDR6941134.1 putative surface protein with fasciclin (FAS1) repeats [Mucilaginibacter pocheonensis]
MKKIEQAGLWFAFAGFLISVASCNLAGLKMQENADYHPYVLDPHIDKTTWQFIKDRSYNFAAKDTIFKLMRQAIEYSGIDTNLYIKTNCTFILLHNDAIFRTTLVNSVPTITDDCYWGKYLVNGKPGTKWSDYPKEQVKNYLLYLIVQGAYSFNNLTPTNVTATTLQPLNYDPLNPNSVMTLRINNDQNYNIRLNDFSNSVGYINVRTTNILAINGAIQVIDKVLYYQTK